MGERRAAGKRVIWAAAGASAVVVAGIAVQWFTSVPNETADRMELVSSAWSSNGTPSLHVVTRLRRSDGRRVNPRGRVWTNKPPAYMRQTTQPDLANRASVITTEIRWVSPAREPVVLECYAVQNRACRGQQLLASWERKLFHRPSRWLPAPTMVRLPDVTVAGPEVASAEK